MTTIIKLLDKLSTSVRQQVYNYQSILSLPRQCLICKSRAHRVHNKNICVYCNNLLIRMSKSCEICGWPIPGSISKCELCVDYKVLGASSRITNKDNNYIFNTKNINNNINIWTDIKIAFPYSSPIDKIIQQFKYLGDLTKGRLLADLLLDYLQYSLYRNDSYPKLPEVIIPVPLYIDKYKKRGFNQSIEIAKYLSKKLDIPMDSNLIAKFKPSDSQMGLNKAGRMHNLEDSFCLNKKANYKSAVIIDDVVTTGSTVMAIAALLRKTNINNISIWAVARRC